MTRGGHLMIKSRLEAKSLRVWLTCIFIVLCIAVGAFAVIGFIGEEMTYSYLPFLDFGLVLEGSVMGYELPAVITENFSFACSLAAVMAIVGLLFHIVYVIVLNHYRAQRRRARRILKKKGYCREYFEILERKHKKFSGRALAPKNDLLLAKEYCDGRKYDSAFAILRDIDLDGFDSKMAASYYNLYARLFVLTGDAESARSTLKMGESFIKRYSRDSGIRLTKALIKYAEGDYDNAKKRFENLLNCKPIETRVWAGLYLGLIYLRLHKKELAKKLAVTLSGYKKTPRQSEDMLKLLKKIEAAYALEEQEALEAANK